MRKVLFLFSILLLLASCGGLKEVKLEKVGTVSNFQKKGKLMTADVVLTVRNENNFPIVVKPSNLDILMNGNKVGVGILNQKVKFDKNKTGEYTANISFENQGIKIFDLVGAALSGKVNLRFLGKVKVGNGTISKKFLVDETKEFTTNDLMNWIK